MVVTEAERAVRLLELKGMDYDEGNGGLARLRDDAKGLGIPAETTRGGLDLRNEIHGEEGSIFTDVTRGTPTRAFTSKPSGYIIEKADLDLGWTQPLPEEAFAYGRQAGMRHFVEHVRDGTTPRETYEDGCTVNCILDVGHELRREGRWGALEGCPARLTPRLPPSPAARPESSAESCGTPRCRAPRASAGRRRG